MFELTILQRNKYDEQMKFYFKEEEVGDMVDMIQTMVKASRNEIEHSIRVIEEGQIADDED